MKSLAKAILSAWARRRLENSLDQLVMGSEVQAYFWRMRAHGGTIRIGSQTRVETRIALERQEAKLSIGSRTFIGQGQISCAHEISIGDDVLIAWGSTIFDHGSHSLRFSQRASDVTDWIRGNKDWSVVRSSPVRVEDKAWVGFGSIILPGVTIGEGAVVGAGSVVTKDVLPWTVCAGNPARQIRELTEDER